MYRLALLAGTAVLFPALLSGSSSADYELPYEEVASGGGCSSSGDYQVVAEISVLSADSPVASADYGVTPSLPAIETASVQAWIELD